MGDIKRRKNGQFAAGKRTTPKPPTAAPDVPGSTDGPKWANDLIDTVKKINDGLDRSIEALKNVAANAPTSSGRTVRFTPVPSQGAIKAEFLINGQVTDSKTMTNTEIEGLEAFMSFYNTVELDAKDFARRVEEEACFDNDGEPTHFEETLYSFTKDLQ